MSVTLNEISTLQFTSRISRNCFCTLPANFSETALLVLYDSSFYALTVVEIADGVIIRNTRPHLKIPDSNIYYSLNCFTHLNTSSLMLTGVPRDFDDTTILYVLQSNNVSSVSDFEEIRQIELKSPPTEILMAKSSDIAYGLIFSESLKILRLDGLFEVNTSETFPEFDLPGKRVMNARIIEGINGSRTTAMAVNGGCIYVFTFINGKINQTYFYNFNSSITEIALFTKGGKSMPCYCMAVACANSPSIVFSNVTEEGAILRDVLADSNGLVTSVCISDVDFDGEDEIMITTFSNVLVILISGAHNIQNRRDLSLKPSSVLQDIVSQRGGFQDPNYKQFRQRKMLHCPKSTCSVQT